MLVNNAGILRDRMLVNMTEAEWDAVIKVHLKGTFAPSHFAANHFRDRSKAGEEVDARIINTTSPSGIYGNVGQTNYGAAKAGIASFTIIAAKELARYGVTVNAIAPAALTRMTEDLGMGQLPEETKEQMSPKRIAPIVVLAGQPAVGRRHRPGVRRDRAHAVGVRGLAPGPVDREPDDDPEVLGPRSSTWSPRPGPTPTWAATTRSDHRGERPCPSTPTPSAAGPSRPAARGPRRTACSTPSASARAPRTR